MSEFLLAHSKIHSMPALIASSHNAFAMMLIDLASDALIESDFFLLMSRMSFLITKSPQGNNPSLSALSQNSLDCPVKNM